MCIHYCYEKWGWNRKERFNGLSLSVWTMYDYDNGKTYVCPSFSIYVNGKIVCITIITWLFFLCDVFEFCLTHGARSFSLFVPCFWRIYCLGFDSLRTILKDGVTMAKEAQSALVAGNIVGRGCLKGNQTIDISNETPKNNFLNRK